MQRRRSGPNVGGSHYLVWITDSITRWVGVLLRRCPCGQTEGRLIQGGSSVHLERTQLAPGPALFHVSVAKIRPSQPEWHVVGVDKKPGEISRGQMRFHPYRKVIWSTRDYLSKSLHGGGRAGLASTRHLGFLAGGSDAAIKLSEGGMNRNGATSHG